MGPDSHASRPSGEDAPALPVYDNLSLATAQEIRPMLPRVLLTHKHGLLCEPPPIGQDDGQAGTSCVKTCKGWVAQASEPDAVSLVKVIYL